jgi:16S rRNA (cytosine967-C5)-methyltransferase
VIAPARRAAYDVGLSVARGADLPAAIARTRERLTDDRDRALAADIATGVERWRGKLDHLAAAFAKRSLDRLDEEVVAILRLSIYQILYLTRVPVSAVVDDGVQLAKASGKRSAAGFVNAVLRSVSRGRTALPLPARPEDPADRDAVLAYFSITLSHPRWLAARWYDRFGFERAEEWLLFNNAHAPLTLRPNTLRASRQQVVGRLRQEGVTVAGGEYASEALTVVDGNPLRTKTFEEGLFIVQNESSQLVTLLAGAAPGPLVLDSCASPGGKTTALAAMMGDRGRVVACDARASRIELLRRTVRTTGATTALIVQADALAPPPFSTAFDCVMIDAPCSGLGTLRRDPDIRWRRQESELALFAESQRQMLRVAAEVVRPGGRMIYATCSSEPEENEDVVAAFLSHASGFRALDAHGIHPLMPDGVIDSRGHLRTTPDRHRLEAFFGAVLQKQPC